MVAYQAHEDDALEVQCLMLVDMEPNLQVQFENMSNISAYEMHKKLETLFQKNARNERKDVVCALINCKLRYGQPTTPYVLNLISLIERHKSLGIEIPKDLVVDIILMSLLDQFGNFVMTYMHQFNVSSLHGMINNDESNVKKEKGSTSSIVMVQNKKVF